MTIHYLTMGSDCSPAAALRNLNLRQYALPFDWIVSDISCLDKCLEDNFLQFHRNLNFNNTKTRFIDSYGFQFPHDYPLNNMINIENDSIGEGVFGEENTAFISDKWVDYYENVLAKYNRRIERFKCIMNDVHPIIVLCRYNTPDVLKLQHLFIKYYSKENIYFINSTTEEFENAKIKNIHTEKNGIWNDASIWKETVDEFVVRIDTNNLGLVKV